MKFNNNKNVSNKIQSQVCFLKQQALQSKSLSKKSFEIRDLTLPALVTILAKQYMLRIKEKNSEQHLKHHW